MLLAGLICLILGGMWSVEIYRSVFYSSVFQLQVLPALQLACSGLERTLQMRGEPARRAAEIYQDFSEQEWVQAALPEEATGYRLLLLCVDGASWKDVEEFSPLPGFERLQREGIATSHHSTILPISTSAWNAIDTGYLPGQTGVLAFQRALNGWPPAWQVVGKRDFSTRTLAQRLEAQGDGVFGISQMNSYPEQIAQGLLIGGWWSNPRGYFATPEPLSEYLRRKGFLPRPDHVKRIRLLYLIWGIWLALAVILMGRYTARRSGRFLRLSLIILAGSAGIFALFSVMYWNSHRELRSPDYFLQVFLEEELYPRIELTRHLYRLPGWRFGAMMVHGIDTLGHHRYRQREIFRGYYEAFDEFLVELLEQADERTLIVVVSDHGFKYYPKAFDLPAWLYHEGYLTDDPESSLAIAENEAAGTVGCIRLRSADLFDEIRERLEALRDPLTGEAVIKQVHSRDSAFQGDQTWQMPDLVLETHPDYEVIAYPADTWNQKRRRYRVAPSNDPLYTAKTPFGAPLKIYTDWYPSGNHEREGLLALWGSAFRTTGNKEAIAIEDIAPTLMVALGVPLPDDLPGQPRLEWFAEEFLSRHPPQHISDPVMPAPPPQESALDPDLLRQLKALDYL